MVKKLWNDLTPLGKIFAWWIIPTALIFKGLIYVFAILAYGVLYVLREDMREDK